MENSIPKQAEVLFRRGNKQVSGGSAGTAWENMLADMLRLLRDDEKLVHISGFQNFGFQGAPASLLTITSQHIIFQAYPGAEAIPLPLEIFTVVERQRNWLGQSDLYMRTIDGFEYKMAMPKDIADPFIQAFTATKGAIK
jgi:hypothetical protein